MSTVAVVATGVLPSLAAAGWHQPVGAALNANPNRYAQQPSIASVKGLPYVAWAEANGSVAQIRVARLGTHAKWDLVGGPFSGSATDSATYPDIAAVGSVPYVTWMGTTPDRNDIHVARLGPNGQWQPIGGRLYGDVEAGGLYPSIATVGGVPYVAWQENRNINSIRVARLEAGVWKLVGNVLNGFGQPQIAAIGGIPYLAFQDVGGSPTQLHVYRLGQDADWHAVGGALVGTEGAHPVSYSIAGVGGVPHVAWEEYKIVPCPPPNPFGCTRTWVWVARLSGGVWHIVGNSLVAHANDPVGAPAIAAVGGIPYVTWIETNDHNHEVRVARLGTGDAWNLIAGPVNANQSTAVFQPVIAPVRRVPFVAWEQDASQSTTENLHRIRAARLEPDFLSQSATPTKTGATLRTRVRTYGIPFPIGFLYGVARHRTTTVTTAAGSSPVTVTRTIGGLSANHKYSYRPFAIAGSPTPLVLGPLATFQTQQAR